ncbi:hypothetical protein RFI_25215 [Reticulomyxa filosa]|uniref:Uncharacterized protein n=1 Tax=Reticulomyxa filosa TaxID=46433 RepID=X6ME27_RETFI|nr:hypothetical protein RFI_25215 [Reticulomyxa filosa]|eukprot:ETO12159.1 hypothetical protein RFI_25215 [Reticulomyxa filosa]
MRLSLDDCYIVLEETEVNPATSKKKIKHTDKLPIVEKIDVNNVSYLYRSANDSNDASANISQTDHFLHEYPPSLSNAIANNEALIHDCLEATIICQNRNGASILDEEILGINKTTKDMDMQHISQLH